MKTPVIHVSNHLNTLITLLRDQLFSPATKPFAKKYVFLPQMSLKSALMTRFLSDKKLDVVTGIEFLELGSGIQSLSGKKLIFPPLDILALHLESLVEEENPHFASALASEFLKYGKFGGEPLTGWKKEVWDKAFKEWNTPFELLERDLEQTNLEVHLYNFPFLPRLYHLFFAKLSQVVPVHYYQFSPCKEFWSDVATDREKVRLIKKDPNVESYLESGHPYLGNFGKLGRETFRVFEEEDFLIDEHYISKPPSTMLTRIQNDILHFQDSNPKPDTSLRLFSASSKMREVEILFQTLLEMDVLPSDIQVFAPDISAYAPFIEHVFGAGDSPYDFSIRDLSKQPLLDSLFLLFNLNRFEPKSIFRLLNSPNFSKLSKKEVETFSTWIKKGGVKWGVDNAHRRRLLPGYLEESESGTWEQVFTHLINNLIFLPKEPSKWDLPYLDFSDSELLGRVITLIRSLRQDLEYIESAELNLIDWAEKIHALFCTYFTITDEETGNLQLLEEKLQMLRELGRINHTLYPFSSIKRYLASTLKEKKGMRPAKQLEAITFRSLKLGSILPSKVIVCLGMNEGTFPRTFIRSSLSLLSSKSDFSPLPSDEDRYLFLEALISAQESLLLFYQNVNEQDGKEAPPSILIQELDLIPENYPPYPFHHQYFSEKKPYPKHHFETAKHFYAPKQSHPFIPEFATPVPLPKSTKEPIEVDVNHLSRFAKNPLRYYCNQTLNLYFPYDDKADEEFQLSPLKKTQLYNETFEEADLRGHVPLGRFKEVARRRLDETPQPEVQTIDLQLENFHITGTFEVPSPEPKLPDQMKTYPLTLIQSGNHEALLRYLHYYQIALLTPSPLHPNFAEALLKKTAPDLAKKLTQDTSDPYLTATLTHADPFIIFETWSPYLHTTFKELLTFDNNRVVKPK